MDGRSLQLHRGGGLGGDVVEDAVDALDLVHDAAGDGVEQLPRQTRKVGRHEVLRLHRAQRDGVIVGALVAHDADRAQVRERGEILVDAALKARLGDLLAEDGVRLADDVQLLLGDVADDADGKARAGEGLTPDKAFGQAELNAELAHLILEETAQGLDDLLEIHMVGKPANVVVALDDDALAADAGFHHVGVDGALREEIDAAELFGLRFKDADELLADDLALALRLGDAGELGEKTLLRVHAHDAHAEAVVHGALDLIALVLAQQAVIDKDAGELFADRAVEERGGHGAVHAAGERQQHLAAADLGADLLNGLADVIRHAPLGGKAADLIEKVLQNFGAVDGMQHLGMELHAVELSFRVLDGGVGAARGVRDGAEAGGKALDLDAVAHPADTRRLNAVEQQTRAVVRQLHLAVLTDLGSAAGAAELMDHQLLAVADAENGQAQLENGVVERGGVRLKHRRGAAGEDDGGGAEGADVVHRHGVGLDLAVDAAFTHAARDEQIVLPAEIQYQYLVHLSRPHGRECRSRPPAR